MSTASDTVKEIVYSHIGGVGDDAARESLCSPSAAEFLDGMASACLGRVRDAGLGSEGECALATVLLHYALSAAAIPSHRKVAVRGVEVDIVSPSVRTLESSPGSALVICIPEVGEAGDIGRAIKMVSAAQTNAKNILVAVCPSAKGIDCEAYSVEDGTFGQILGRLRGFLAASGSGRLGVLGSTVQAK